MRKVKCMGESLVHIMSMQYGLQVVLVVLTGRTLLASEYEEAERTSLVGIQILDMDLKVNFASGLSSNHGNLSCPDL